MNKLVPDYNGGVDSFYTKHCKGCQHFFHPANLYDGLCIYCVQRTEKKHPELPEGWHWISEKELDNMGKARLWPLVIVPSAWLLGTAVYVLAKWLADVP